MSKPIDRMSVLIPSLPEKDIPLGHKSLSRRNLCPSGISFSGNEGMSKPIDRMSVLIPSLPEKDIPLGHKFLRDRDFDSLKELVDSAIYKVKKSRSNESSKDKYSEVNLEDLSKLKSEVDLYIIRINPTDELEGTYCMEDFEDNYEINEESYY